MKRTNFVWLVASAGALLATLGVGAQSAPAASPQPTLTLLYTFSKVGADPTAIAEVVPGLFFGLQGVSPAIFSVTSAGAYHAIYYFPTNTSGVNVAGLTPALNGQTYGGAENLGPVTTFSELFSVGAGGKVSTYPYTPSSTGEPGDPLTQSPDNHLYGFFEMVDTPATFTRFDYNGTPTPLYSFTSAQGYPASGAPVFASDGNFYGVTVIDSGASAGIFRLTPSGSFSWLVPSFSTGKYGADDQLAFIQAANGNFYGTLPSGGSANAGSIYQVTPSGDMTTLYQFPVLQLGVPQSLLQASDGMLYGTAHGYPLAGYYSSIFRLNPNTLEFQTIATFKNSLLGECDCRIVQGTDGKIYGVAAGGGTYVLGTVWVLDAGLPPPPPRVQLLKPRTGAVGQRVLIWGANLLCTTGVSFKGAAATTFTVASGQGVWANVPNGAATGPVTVTTPNGSFTSKESFTVQ